MSHFLGRPFEIKQKSSTDRKSKLRSLLSTPVADRTDGQTYEIAQLVKENPFLLHYAGNSHFFRLVKQLRLVQYSYLQTIVECGTVGTCFYMILGGRVGFFSNDSKNSKIKELMTGSSFGESSLLATEVQIATVTALESTELIVLEKSDFDAIVRTSQGKQVHEAFLFFQDLPPMKKVSGKLLHSFSQLAYIKTFALNEVILEQDEFSPGIYFICEGSAKIIKSVMFDSRSYKKIIIDELSSGDMFCDHSYFSKTPMQYSVVCSMPLTTYCLEKEDLNNIDKSCLNDLRRLSKSYPEDNKLKTMYLQKFEWSNYTKNMVKTINIEKELRW